MKAQVIERFGEPSVFTLADIPKPKIRPGHVLIRVAATSVNPLDARLRRQGGPLVPSLPAVLHVDVAGVVEEVGAGVHDFVVGDEVYGCAGGVAGNMGALAQYMLADANLIAPKPRSLSLVEAAALPVVAVTAWEGLKYRAAVDGSKTVLVHAATGGVGHIAIQLAKALGARVFATASSAEKLEIARKLGADAGINYKTEPVAEYVRKHTAGRGFDVVYDTVGGKNLDASFEAVAVNGAVITCQSRSTHDLTPLHGKGVTLHVVFMLIPLIHGIDRARHGKTLREAADLVDSGRLRPLIDTEKFSFADIGQAHARLESGKAIGKVVVAF